MYTGLKDGGLGAGDKHNSQSSKHRKDAKENPSSKSDRRISNRSSHFQKGLSTIAFPRLIFSTTWCCQLLGPLVLSYKSKQKLSRNLKSPSCLNGVRERCVPFQTTWPALYNGQEQGKQTATKMLLYKGVPQKKTTKLQISLRSQSSQHIRDAVIRKTPYGLFLWERKLFCDK